MSRLARRHVTVALCGDGGDELFGGYNRYVYGTRVLSRVDRIPRTLRHAAAAGINRIPAATWDRLSGLTRLMPGLPASRVGERMNKLTDIMAAGSVGDMYCSLLSAWQQPPRVGPCGHQPGDVNEMVLAEMNPSGCSTG